MFEKTMTANGVLLVSGGKTTMPSSTLHFKGDAAGGQITIGFINNTGAFVPYESGVVLPADSRLVRHGLDVNLAVELSGAGTPALEVFSASG